MLSKIKLAQQDLSTFSDQDLYTLADYLQIPRFNRQNLCWQIAVQLHCHIANMYGETTCENKIVELYRYVPTQNVPDPLDKKYKASALDFVWNLVQNSDLGISQLANMLFTVECGIIVDTDLHINLYMQDDGPTVVLLNFQRGLDHSLVAVIHDQKRVEVFDPNSSSNTAEDQKVIDDGINIFVESFDVADRQILRPVDVCPRNVNIQGRGLCVWWSMLFLYLRLSCLAVPIQEVTRTLTIMSPGELRFLITKFAILVADYFGK